MEHLDAPTLLLAMTVFNGFAMASWLLMGEVLRLAPTTCRLMASAHGLRIAAALLSLQALGLGPHLRELAVDLTGLAGVGLLCLALRRMVSRWERWRDLAGVWLAGSVAVVVAVSQGALDAALGSAYVATAVLAAIAGRDALGVLRRHAPPWVCAAMAAPFAGLFVLSAWRAVARLWLPAWDAVFMLDRTPTVALSLLWWLLTAAVSLALAALLIWRLVLRIQSLMRIDALTGVLNRRAMQAELVQAQAMLLRGHGYALLMADIDHFKRINDSQGHAGGDAALRHCVSVWKTCLRGIDRLGRMGGEEFAVLLPGADLKRAAIVAERMRARLAGTPLQLGSTRLSLQASFGVALALPGDASGEAGLARADAQLYRAKALGRNRVCTEEAPPP